MATRYMNIEYRLAEDGENTTEMEVNQELRVKMIGNMDPVDPTEDHSDAFHTGYSVGLNWIKTASVDAFFPLVDDYTTHREKYEASEENPDYFKTKQSITEPVITGLMKSILNVKGEIPVTLKTMDIEYGIVEAMRSAYYSYEDAFVTMINRKDPRMIITETVGG